MSLPFHRKLRRRIAAPVYLAIRAMAVLLGKRKFQRVEGAEALYKYRKGRGELDRAQWRRWWKANQKHQRQLAAYKRTGHGRRIRIDPKVTGLPRAYVP